MWATVGSWAKYWQIAPEQVLYDISYANILLYGKATPSYDTDSPSDTDTTTRSTEDLDWGGAMDYSNPDNFTDITEDRKRI